MLVTQLCVRDRVRCGTMGACPSQKTMAGFRLLADRIEGVAAPGDVGASCTATCKTLGRTLDPSTFMSGVEQTKQGSR